MLSEVVFWLPHTYEHICNCSVYTLVHTQTHETWYISENIYQETLKI